jgi:hypothetical protein
MNIRYNELRKDADGLLLLVELTHHFESKH